MTIYNTARPRGKFANENAMALLGQRRQNGTSKPRGVKKNAMALLGQSRDSWKSTAYLGHVELTKMQKLLEIENKNENEKQIENENENLLILITDNL